jgi:orotidine-5'-phosphate decarboxylase
MPGHFADRLLEAIARKGSPVCVGLDVAVEHLPAALAVRPQAPRAEKVAAVRAFCEGVLEAVAPIVPAVKPQIAFFEQLGPPGYALYHAVVKQARKLGLVVIGDIKRGDIGSTAEAYAAAHLSGPDAPDAVTVNGYFGADGIEPFIKAAQPRGRGLFVLVRTSNPSAATLQDFTDASGKKLYELAAEQLARQGSRAELIGDSGYSCVGAVVGATWPAQARRLRELMPRQLFLVPGYGAQGATAKDCAAAFKDDGTGAIVNASRSVLLAHRRGDLAGMDWRQAIQQAARELADDIRSALGR